MLNKKSSPFANYFFITYTMLSKKSSRQGIWFCCKMVGALAHLFISYDIADNHCEEKENKHNLKHKYRITPKSNWNNIRANCYCIANSIIKSLWHIVNAFKEMAQSECYERERDGYFAIINKIEYKSPRYIHRGFTVNFSEDVFVNPKLEYIK